MVLFRFYILFILLSTVNACVSYSPKNPNNRPFRYGLMRFNPTQDVIKPLAMADYSGWRLNKDLLIGAVDENWVMANHFSDKKIAWWLNTPTPLSAPVSSIDEWVILGLRDGSVLKVEAQTGKTLWQTKLDTYSPREVTVVGRMLYILTSGQQLYAMDFTSGNTMWLYDAGFPDNLTLQAGPPPVVHNNVVYIGVASGEILAIDASTGGLIWRFDPEFNDARFHDVIGEMVVVNGTLLLSRYDGLVAAYDVGGNVHNKVWQETIASVTTSAFRDGKYYVGCINGDVYAFDANSGKRLWRTQTGTPISNITAGETALFVAGTNGRINAINAGNGDVEWYDDIGGEIAHKPFIYKDAIFFSTGLKNLYGYKITTANETPRVSSSSRRSFRLGH